MHSLGIPVLDRAHAIRLELHCKAQLSVMRLRSWSSVAHGDIRDRQKTCVLKIHGRPCPDQRRMLSEQLYRRGRVSREEERVDRVICLRSANRGHERPFNADSELAIYVFSDSSFLRAATSDNQQSLENDSDKNN